MRKLVTIDSVSVQETQEVVSKALALPDQARAMKVEDSESFAKANQFFVMAHSLEKEITKTFSKIKKATHDAWKTVTKEESDAMAPVSLAKAIVKKEIEQYAEIQREITQARERVAQEEERRKAETRQVERAAALEQQGHAALAEQVLAAPIQVPQVSLPTVKEELVGAGFVDQWKYRVVDATALLQAAVDGKIAFSVKDPDEEKTTGAVQVSIEVGKLLGGTKEMFSLPGVKAWTEQTLRAAGR